MNKNTAHQEKTFALLADTFKKYNVSPKGIHSSGVKNHNKTQEKALTPAQKLMLARRAKSN
ncbi:MAG: hypothetical protein PHE89_04965 [Alphaproteobacteria bacterium]|nr:hypothetical protein [Alphaproteobacteria bacterium]